MGMLHAQKPSSHVEPVVRLVRLPKHEQNIGQIMSGTERAAMALPLRGVATIRLTVTVVSEI
jgi:hypothetical protein